MVDYNFNVNVRIKEEHAEAIDGFLMAWKQDRSLRFDKNKKELGISYILHLLNACVKGCSEENS